MSLIFGTSNQNIIGISYTIMSNFNEKAMIVPAYGTDGRALEQTAVNKTSTAKAEMYNDGIMFTPGGSVTATSGLAIQVESASDIRNNTDFGRVSIEGVRYDLGEIYNRMTQETNPTPSEPENP